MGEHLSKLKPPKGSRHKTKRVARGPGSGTGKTAGRGEKGQTSRSGKGTGVKVGFEGGQMPLQRRLPKRGFINPFRREMEIVNLRDLLRFEAGSVVDPEALAAAGLVPTLKNGVKVLGVGDLDRALTVRAHAISESARKKVEAAGGKVELLSTRALSAEAPAQAEAVGEPGQTDSAD